MRDIILPALLSLLVCLPALADDPPATQPDAPDAADAPAKLTLRSFADVRRHVPDEVEPAAGEGLEDWFPRFKSWYESVVDGSRIAGRFKLGDPSRGEDGRLRVALGRTSQADAKLGGKSIVPVRVWVTGANDESAERLAKLLEQRRSTTRVDGVIKVDSLWTARRQATDLVDIEVTIHAESIR